MPLSEDLRCRATSLELVHRWRGHGRTWLRRRPRRHRTAVGLEEVLVTAQRVETNLQTTPVAVTALGGDFLQQFNFRNVTSIEGAAPNLNFAASTGGASSQVSAFIRGVGEFDFLLTTDPAVGLYIDGVYLARTFGVNLDLADVDRVEVLRGPQGTLFGKNNIGGAINLITRTPEGSGDIRAELTGGSYNSWRALGRRRHAARRRPGAAPVRGRPQVGRLAGHGPMPMAARRTASRRAASLRWTPGETFDSTLTLDYVDQNQTNYPNNMVVFDADASQFLGLFNGFVSPRRIPAARPMPASTRATCPTGCCPTTTSRASGPPGSTTGASRAAWNCARSRPTATWKHSSVATATTPRSTTTATSTTRTTSSSRRNSSSRARATTASTGSRGSITSRRRPGTARGS